MKGFKRLNIKILLYIISVILLIFVIVLFIQNKGLKEDIVGLNSDISILNERLNIKEDTLEETTKEKNELDQTLAEERNRIENFEDQIDQYSGEIDVLEKLTTIDPELLKKYSKIYFLNEHYEPDDLTEIDEEFTVNNEERDHEILEKIDEYLEDLLEDAKDDGLDLKIVSAFRSFGTQQELKSKYTFIYGAGTANQFSADQGYSEHQLGTAVDFTTTQIGASFSGFQNTAEYKWLKENAHEYGFVLSYPENNSYYQFEPWHWRFVGVELAEDLHSDKMYFYDMSQRDIDEYLIKLFD